MVIEDKLLVSVAQIVVELHLSTIVLRPVYNVHTAPLVTVCTDGIHALATVNLGQCPSLGGFDTLIVILNDGGIVGSAVVVKVEKLATVAIL